MKTRYIAEGAIFTALTTVLTLISLYVPIISIVAMFVASIPISLLVYRTNFTTGVIASFATAILVSIFVGPLYGIVAVIGIAGIGLWLGYAFKHSLRPLATLAITVVISALAMALEIVLSVLITGLPLSEMLVGVESMVDDMILIYQEAGILDTMLEGWTLEGFTAYMIEMINLILPAAYILSSMLMACISYFFTAKIMRRFGCSVASLPKFRYWRMDWVYLWGIIVGLACLLLANQFDIDILWTIGVNIFYIYLPILFIIGLSAIIYAFGIYKSTFMKVMLVILLFLSPMVTIFSLCLFGIFDSILDFRARYEAQNKL